MMNRLYSSKDFEIQTFVLNKGDKVEMHDHEWDHEVICVFGRVTYFEKDFTKEIFDTDKSGLLAKANVMHGFQANMGFSIVLNIRKLKD